MSDARKPTKKSKAPTGQQKRNFFATLSADVIKSIKRAALDDDTTASEILNEAARDWLERRRHKTSKAG
ncbi:hypothetical protein ACVWW6_004222 [Bradyrhizobium sp. USDA 3311]|uniref:hypothetical protein n=1 Tax=Bradyrhizobium sp. CCBAU 45394 TaxID=1325087 RepID=UPI0023032ECD|nr:hypothetical protein [Bradyrhizobium sp. CCBAU 45394]MDA9391820.1 hypothetical protein [Bradyrhizobium sp. CCBAU 45394]